MGKRRYDLLVPVTQIYRRSIVVAASLLTDGTEGDLDLSLAPKQVGLNDGDWVTIDASQKAVKGVASDRIAMPVWTDGARYDVRAGEAITAIYGPHWASTAVFITTGLTSVGLELTLGTGGDSGKLVLANSGDIVRAFLERIPHSVSSSFPDGFIDITSVGAGYKKES